MCQGSLGDGKVKRDGKVKSKGARDAKSVEAGDSTTMKKNACADTHLALTRSADGEPLFCGQLVALCVDKEQGPDLHKKCPETCGLCSGLGTITCADTPKLGYLQEEFR